VDKKELKKILAGLSIAGLLTGGALVTNGFPLKGVAVEAEARVRAAPRRINLRARAVETGPNPVQVMPDKAVEAGINSAVCTTRRPLHINQGNLFTNRESSVVSLP
jgi:radical SAM modification target selenobiotic family peptide